MRMLICSETRLTTNMESGSEETAGLIGEKEDDSDDKDENSIDLGLSGLPRVNFSRPKNEFETINLDGDDEEEEDPSDRDHSDEKRKKKYRKKIKRNLPPEHSSESSSDDEKRRSSRKKEKDIDPVSICNTSLQCQAKT